MGPLIVLAVSALALNIGIFLLVRRISLAAKRRRDDPVRRLLKAKD